MKTIYLWLKNVENQFTLFWFENVFTSLFCRFWP